jgi:hypothetical protein
MRKRYRNIHDNIFLMMAFRCEGKEREKKMEIIHMINKEAKFSRVSLEAHSFRTAKHFFSVTKALLIDHHFPILLCIESAHIHVFRN